jgi:hypothetical protein
MTNPTFAEENPHMPDVNPALLPSPALFDVTTVPEAAVEGTIERVPLAELELAENPRKQVSSDSINSLAGLLMRTGQLIPCIGVRPAPADRRVVLYDGQRLLLAAQASQELAGSDGYEALNPVQSLIVLLLDHEPAATRSAGSKPRPTSARTSRSQTSRSSSATAGKRVQDFARTTGSPPCAPTSASRRKRRTTYAASSRSPSRSASASPSGPQAGSCR